jgi:hypothetical protein
VLLPEVRVIHRLIPSALLVAGVALFALVAYEYYAPGAGPALAVEQTDIEFSALLPEKETTVVFHLDNRSGRPLRVVGIAGC